MKAMFGKILTATLLSCLNMMMTQSGSADRFDENGRIRFLRPVSIIHTELRTLTATVL